MGRTKRTRDCKKHQIPISFLDTDSKIIALKKWLQMNNWKNSNSLRLALFENTGRGLTSPKDILPFNVLLQIPFDLMITFTSLEESFLCNTLLPNSLGSLSIQDILSIYLVFEQHKGIKSKWKIYLDSLPKNIPPLPWLCSSDEVVNIPEDLKLAIMERSHSFNSSWQRSYESIDPKWFCECCTLSGHSLLTLNTFTWAYIMVNTRAVYVDPDIIYEFARSYRSHSNYGLLGSPCMALCPYLDLFNHSNKVLTEAKLEKVNGKWVYKLITLTQFKKYEEIFISYGFHNNSKLLCEYGFFIPDEDNELEMIYFDFKELLNIGAISLNAKQYKFICSKNFDSDLNIGVNNLSFNLKAVLFVSLTCNNVDWCSSIFNESYSNECLIKIGVIAAQLIQAKINKCSTEYEMLNQSVDNKSESLRCILNYLNYRLIFMKKILKSTFFMA